MTEDIMTAIGFIYTGDDPILRWYADNGADWFDQARFDEHNRLVFLAWREAVGGRDYRVTLDRGHVEGQRSEAASPEQSKSLRLIVELGDRLVLTEPMPTTACGSGPARQHHAGGFHRAGYFFMKGQCAARQLNIAATFFTEATWHVQRARAVAAQALERAAEARNTISIVTAASGIFTNCGAMPWR
jgi:hypothetical protein